MAASGLARGAGREGWLSRPELFVGPPAKLQSTLRGRESKLAAGGSLFMLEIMAKIISPSATAAWR